MAIGTEEPPSFTMDLACQLQALALSDHDEKEVRILVSTSQSSLVLATAKRDLMNHGLHKRLSVTAIVWTERDAEFIVENVCRLAPDPYTDRWAFRNLSEDGPLVTIQVLNLREVNRTEIDPYCDCWLESPGTYQLFDAVRNKHIISLRLLPRPGLQLQTVPSENKLRPVTNGDCKRSLEPEEDSASKRLQLGERDRRVAIPAAAVVRTAPCIMDLSVLRENETATLNSPKRYSLTKQKVIFSFTTKRNPTFIGAHSDYKKTVFVKVLSKIGQTATELLNAVDMWILELEMNEGLRHENLAEFLEGDARILCLVYTYVNGGNLSMLRNPKSDFYNGVDEHAYQIAQAISRALDYLHLKKRIHNDIKPENIIISLLGEQTLVCDLGLSSLSPRSSNGGTHGYVPPDVWISPLSRGFAGDVWAFGLTIFFICREIPLPEKFIERYDFKLARDGDVESMKIREEGYKKIQAVRMVVAKKLKTYSPLMRLLLEIGVEALDPSPSLRPSMSQVVQRLHGLNLQQEAAPASDPTILASAPTRISKMLLEASEKLNPSAPTDPYHAELETSRVLHSSQTGSTQTLSSQVYRDAITVPSESRGAVITLD